MSDPRFARLKSDPRFRRIRKKEAKVVVDERFKSIFGDGKGKKKKKGKKEREKNKASGRSKSKEDEDQEFLMKYVYAIFQSSYSAHKE